MIIEICETNEARQLLKQMREQFPDAEVVTHRCMSRCIGCFQCLFAYVNDELVEAWSPEMFFEKLKEQM